MANVMELLRKIKTAIYGRDVRQSIYDAILQCYQDATGNPESIAAHTGDTNNPHNVTAEQVGLGTASEDIANAKNDIEKLKTPEFDDFTEDGSTPPDARTAIAALTSKMSIFTAISKIKAALMGLVTLGEMRDLLINNGLTTEAGKYFLDAAFGKTLADKDTELAALIAKLNSDQKDNAVITLTLNSEYCEELGVSMAMLTRNLFGVHIAFKAKNTIPIGTTIVSFSKNLWEGCQFKAANNIATWTKSGAIFTYNITADGYVTTGIAIASGDYVGLDFVALLVVND